MSDLRELYQEVIIDHTKSPRNFYKMALPTHTAEGLNSLCGDHLSLYLQVQDNTIQEVSFEGSGCAISTASSSLMTEILKGKTLQESEALFATFHALLTGTSHVDDVPEMGKLQVLAGVKAYPSRVKCATLAWHTFQAALAGGQCASTE